MKKDEPGNNLSRLIQAVWVINIVGALAILVFLWFELTPAQAVAIPITQNNLPAQNSPIITPGFKTTLETGYTSGASTQIIEQPEIVTPVLNPTAIPDNPEIIGYSVAGRPLEVYRYGNGPIGRIIVAGIHGGNEANTIKLAHELMDYIEKHPAIVPDNVTLYILPDLNPDGEARAHNVDGRVNDHGVDLNRNWPYKWVKDYDRSSCWHYRPTTAGDYAASEPETAALLAFIVSHPEIDGLISYHAAALGIFAGGVPDFKPSIRLAESLAKVSTFRYPPKDIGCVYTGNLTDWASSTMKIAAVDIELHDFKHTDIDENLKILKTFLKFRK